MRTSYLPISSLPSGYPLLTRLSLRTNPALRLTLCRTVVQSIPLAPIRHLRTASRPALAPRTPPACLLDEANQPLKTHTVLPDPGFPAIRRTSSKKTDGVKTWLNQRPRDDPWSSVSRMGLQIQDVSQVDGARQLARLEQDMKDTDSSKRGD